MKHRYLFRGRIRCDICGRKMEGSPRKKAMYYRCPARTLAPGSPVLASHPGAVYLREDALQGAAIDSIGDVSAALRGSAPTRLEELYEAIDLQVRYKQPPTLLMSPSTPWGVNNTGVRGGLEFSYVASLRSSRVHALLNSSKPA